MARAAPRLTVAVCAFNEEANIGRLLERLLADEAIAGSEILVVSSASIDRTDAIVAELAANQPRLRLIREEERRGKVAAVALALASAVGDLILLVDADCLPAPGALAAALAPLADPAVGGVGTRNRPVNGDDSWTARAAAVMWELHHRVCLESPVLGGDIVAFRRLVPLAATGASAGQASSLAGPRAGETTVEVAIDPAAGINDDFLIEQSLAARGLTIAYAPGAVTLMRVPTTPGEFIRQRRRIHYGFLREHRTGRRAKSTQSGRLAFAATASLLKEKPASVAALGLLVLLDTCAKVLARLDLRSGASHSAWAPSPTTKAPIETSWG